MSSKQNHRIPTKQTPFTSGGNGGSSNNNDAATATAARSSSHSHNQRTIMTKTIRKAKRGQVVARKRHLYNFASSGGVGGGTIGSGGVVGGGGISSSNMGGVEVSMEVNPYSRDAQYVQRTIQLSRNVVHLCLQHWQEKSNSHHHQQHQQQQKHNVELATTLDQLCVLLTPDNNDINPSSSGITRHQQKQQQQQGASYDSSMAGMAANSILSQFEDSVNDYSNNNSSNSSNSSNNLAVLLANSLGYILSSSYNEHNNTTNDDNIVQIKAAIVLNQLAATDPPPPPSSQQHYQMEHQIQLAESTTTTNTATATTREIPTSWCHVFVNSKDLLGSLLHQLPPLHNNNINNNNNNSSSIALTEKCISIIGNLLGDSYVAHTTLLQMNVISKLVGCVQFGLGMLDHATTTTTASAGVMISILQLVRNSVWSLINVIRGGDGGGGEGESSSSSSSLIKDISQGINLEVLLSLPESIQSILNTQTDSNSNNVVECIRALFDVAIETCWLIVFLTNRNDDTSSTSTTLFGFEIVSGLLKRLCTCTFAATERFRQQSTLPGSYSLFHENPSYGDDELSQSLSNGSIPCCRAFTNISIYLEHCSTSIDIDTAYEDAMAAREVKENYNGILLSEMTTRCLVELISLGSIGGGNEASTIACSATILAGICLVDGSHEMNKNPHYQEEQQQQHSAVAAVVVKTLLPALMEGLISPLSTYDFKREIVWALWNMFQSNQLQDDTRFSLLNEIINHRLEPERVVQPLTFMLTALESSDAVEPCLGLVDLFLRAGRELPDTTGRSIKVLFEEVGLVDALWYICDNDVDESDVAEKAAELIDDYYEEQEEDDEVRDVNGMMTVPSMNGGQFQFQAPQPNSGQFFNFTNN